LKTSETAMTS